MFKWPQKAGDESGNAEMPWEQALAILILAHLSSTGQRKLTQLAARFLQQKRLVALQGLEFTPLHQARIALLFCLPVLGLGIEQLDGFHEVLIYPAPFVMDDEWEDDISLAHNQRVVQSGQSWQQGPVVLNWLDIQDSSDASGLNLVVYEVVHKLDARSDGWASGVPLIPLHGVAGWEHDFHAAMNNIQGEIDLVGESTASIDAYAATDPAECFAALSEYFFSAPELFVSRSPALRQCFCHFYQQDPLQRICEDSLQDEDNQRTVH